MRSAILDKGEQYYTYMGKIFKAIENKQTEYNWLISNCECYPHDKKLYELFSKEYIWIPGEQLTEVISKENFQFIWGVFSGFPKDITLEEVLKYDLSFDDGYGGFWVDDVIIQHPLANIEIVVWDSSMTLLISTYDELVEKFRSSFPLSEDLSARNTRDNSEIAHVEELLISELVKRNVSISEKILHQKYSIWRELYLKRNLSVKDEDILQCINKSLILINERKS